jgi:hypothetical protein
MTRRIGNVVVLEEEPPSKCAQCGLIEETRPYGKDGERLCAHCAERPENMPHVEAALARLFGVKPQG